MTTKAYTSTNAVSAMNCPWNDAVRQRPYAPLGSSVWTSSGQLSARGITAIAQAATGTMPPHVVKGGEPTRDSVSDAVQNALVQAAQNGRGRLAIPFLASGIFASRMNPPCSKSELAGVIVRSAKAHAGRVTPVIVAWDHRDHADFKAAIAQEKATQVELVEGSITDFSLHGCDVIVNAANMEVRFGGGISGAIGSATGEISKIDAEAAREVAAFWSANPGG